MSCSRDAPGLPCSDSVVRRVGTRWNAWSNASAGGSAAGGRRPGAARAGANGERSIWWRRGSRR